MLHVNQKLKRKKSNFSLRKLIMGHKMHVIKHVKPKSNYGPLIILTKPILTS